MLNQNSTIESCEYNIRMAEQRYDIAASSYINAREHMDQIQRDYKPWAPKWEEAKTKLHLAERILSCRRDDYLKAKAILGCALQESGYFATILG